jgi:hypothetical protein
LVVAIANFEIFALMVGQPTTREMITSNKLHLARAGLAAMFLNRDESTINEQKCERWVPSTMCCCLDWSSNGSLTLGARATRKINPLDSPLISNPDTRARKGDELTGASSDKAISDRQARKFNQELHIGSHSTKQIIKDKDFETRCATQARSAPHPKRT